MKKFWIDDKEYSMPTSLKEVELVDFIQVQKAIREAEDLHEKKIKVVSGLMGVEEEILWDAETKLVNILFDELEFFEKYQPGQPAASFEHEGETYCVNPFDNSKFREFAAYEKATSQYNASPEAIPYQMAIMCRKKDEDYKTVNVAERAMLFESVDAELGNNIAGFFLAREKQYRESLNLSSRLSQMKEVLHENLQRISTRSTDGSVRLCLWQRMLAKLILYSIPR